MTRKTRQAIRVTYFFQFSNAEKDWRKVMGDRIPGGGRGTQGIIYVEGRNGPEVTGVINVPAGRSLADVVAERGLARGERITPYTPTGGSRITADDLDDPQTALTVLGRTRQARTAGSQSGAGGGIGRLSGAFGQANIRSSSARRGAQAAAKEGVLAEANRTRQRVLRATRGQSDARRRAALRRENLPGSVLRAPVTIDQINRGRVRG